MWGVVESCASEALQHATSAETAWIVFHVGTDDEALGQGRCIVERCFGQCVGASRHRHASSLVDEVRSFVPQEMCPEGSSGILPELGALGGADGVLRPEAAELEFLRLFGPLKLQNQTLQSLRMECIETAHRAVAKVCLQDGCDEWSKYSLPRCDVILGLPYDFGDSNFALAPACVLSGQYYCPLGLPLALKVTLKAASRSAAIWAMMLEGLMPAVVSARRTLSVALSSKGNIPSFLREWIEQEEIRLGCSPELQFFSISRWDGPKNTVSDRAASRNIRIPPCSIWLSSRSCILPAKVGGKAGGAGSDWPSYGTLPDLLSNGGWPIARGVFEGSVGEDVKLLSWVFSAAQGALAPSKRSALV